jgi:hypothetical protein
MLNNLKNWLNIEPMLGADGTHPVGLHSYKSFEAGVQPKATQVICIFWLICDNSPVHVRYIVFFLFGPLV